MPSQYYYVLNDGSMSASGNVRVDPPDENSPYYIDGQYSQYWESDWAARIDGTISGYPAEGQSWNFTTNSWYFTKEALKEAARETRQNLENNSSIFYLGKTIPVSRNNVNILSSLAQISRLENPNDTTGVRFDSNKNCISMSNADFIGLVDAVLNHFQSIIDAEVQVVAQIEDETITDAANIDAALETAMETPFQHIAPITDLYTTVNNKAAMSDIDNAISTLTESTIADMQTVINSKQETITPASTIADASAAIEIGLLTDYSPSSGYTSIINEGINSSNAAYNDLATKHNDLVTKFNTLLAHLKAQGLQTP